MICVFPLFFVEDREDWRDGRAAGVRGGLSSRNTVSGSCVPCGPVSPLARLFLAPALDWRNRCCIQPFLFLYIIEPHQQYLFNHPHWIVNVSMTHLEHVQIIFLLKVKYLFLDVNLSLICRDFYK